MGSTNRPFLLGEVGSIVQLTLHDFCGEVRGCAPAALKKFNNSNTRASKQDVMRKIEATDKLAFTDDNKADAYVLAKVGIALLAPAPPSTRKQAEVVARITGRAKKPPKKRSFRMSKGVL